MIPVFDAGFQYQELKSEIDAAMQAVAAAGHYILGPQVKAFEEEMAAALSCRHAIGVANGTDALHLALRALRIGPGDEVITTPFTFVATAEAIGLVNATPVFVDIDPQSFNIDPRCIEAAITPRTRAILPVHLYGRPCDMNRIMSIARANDLHVVEDCAQALGATYRGRPVGSFGTVGCFSFFPSKNLGCMGDGGMLVTSDPELSDRIEMLRRHGGKVKYHHEELGLNSRLDELQAAILRVKLPYLARWNAARRGIAARYTQGLADVAAAHCPIHTDDDAAGHVFHQYTLRVPDRDRLARDLATAGITTAVYYPVPLHLQGVHAGLSYAPGCLPHAERAASQCLSLPMFPGLTALQVERVVAACRRSMEPAATGALHPTPNSLQAA
ncbi:MAG: DegT/DnrJ/EryC1/StrS family aminotransferase [Planctomycetota bacterium]